MISPPGGDGKVEFDLEHRSVLSFSFAHNKPARRVDVTIGFRESAGIDVSAMMGAIPVAQAKAKGNAGDVVSVTLEFDVISAVQIGSGRAALIDLCFVLVSDGATKDWEPVPHFPYPMRLPVTHPDYPCTLGMNEDIDAARIMARDRILYDKPDAYVSSTPLAFPTGVGTISVTNGSPLVTGSNTHWDQNMQDVLLRIHGDSAIYGVIRVISDNKLVLTRAYEGTSHHSIAYTVCQNDEFNQLHDQLIQLVTGGPGSTRMGDRYVPVPIHEAGTVSVKQASKVVQGANTHWTSSLVGLDFQVGSEEVI